MLSDRANRKLMYNHGQKQGGLKSKEIDGWGIS